MIKNNRFDSDWLKEVGYKHFEYILEHDEYKYFECLIPLMCDEFCPGNINKIQTFGLWTTK